MCDSWGCTVASHIPATQGDPGRLSSAMEETIIWCGRHVHTMYLPVHERRNCALISIWFR